MAKSVIQLAVLSDSGQEMRTTWLTDADLQSFADLAEEGCRRLRLQNTFEFDLFELYHHGSRNVKSRFTSLDDIIILGSPYLLIDKKIGMTAALKTEPQYDASNNAQLALHTPTTSSSDLWSSASTDYMSTPTSTRSSKQVTKEQLTKRGEMLAYYNKNRSVIDNAFDTYVPQDPLIFSSVNIYTFFALRKEYVTAVYILRESINDDALREKATSMICTGLIDVVNFANAMNDICATDRRILASHAAALTMCDNLLSISLKNGNGMLDTRMKRNKARNTSGPTPKKSRLSIPGIISMTDLSLSLNPLNGREVLHAAYKDSSQLRHKWIKDLLKDDRLERGVATEVINKFHHLKSDISLLHYDFINVMASRRSTIVSLAVEYRRFIPAIKSLASKKSIAYDIPACDPYEEELHCFPLLVHLCFMYCRRSSYDLQNLILDYTKSINIFDALHHKLDKGITAPVIIALGSVPHTTYYIAVDDIPLKVDGSFADALQSFMEVVYTFNLKYDMSTTGITFFLESLMGFPASISTSRKTLLNALKDELDVTSSESSELLNSTLNESTAAEEELQ